MTIKAHYQKDQYVDILVFVDIDTNQHVATYYPEPDSLTVQRHVTTEQLMRAFYGPILAKLKAGEVPPMEPAPVSRAGAGKLKDKKPQKSRKK